MKEFGQPIKRFTPVAELVFLFSGHLSKGFFMTLGNEHRVISETFWTAGFPSYTTFGVAEKGLYRSIRKGEGHATDKPGSSFIIRDPVELCQKFLIIPDVVSPATVACISRRVDAWRTTKRIYLQSRVISKSRLARALTNFGSLLYCIPFKGIFVLNGFRTIRKIVEREYGDRQINSDPFDLFNLFFVSRGKHNFHS